MEKGEKYNTEAVISSDLSQEGHLEETKVEAVLSTNPITNSLSNNSFTNVDRAYAIGLELEQKQESFTQEAENAVLRKIDIYILPVMCVLTACQLMDKGSTSYAAIIGLKSDLGLTTEYYSWSGTSFYLGYLFGLYPANLILQKAPARSLSIAVIIWGVVVCLHAAITDGKTFLICRTFLGFLESFMHPCFMILTGQWYKRSEQYVRNSYWLAFAGFGTILGSGIGYGFYTHEGSYAYAPWKLLYLTLGSITIFFGLITLFHVPNVPTNAWFLNDKEKSIVVSRIRDNKTGFGSTKFKMDQFKEALKDPAIYLFFFFMFGYGIQNGSLGTFGSIILEDEFKYSKGQSVLMNMVDGGFDIVAPLLFAYLTKYYLKSRVVMSVILNANVYLGILLLAYAPQNNAKIFGYYWTDLNTASWATMSSIVISNTAGSTKKTVANFSLLVGFTVGNMIGPRAFKDDEAPDYITAKRMMVGCYVISVISPIMMYFLYYYRNKKTEELLLENTDQLELTDVQKAELEFGDLTDLKNPTFKYVL